MSAFVVSKEHIDLLVDVAKDGPRAYHGGPSNPWHVTWYSRTTEEIVAETEGQEWEVRAAALGDSRRDANHEDPSSVGAMLIGENIASINARYPDTVENPSGMPGPVNHYWEGEGYTFTRHGFSLSVAEALSAVACYEYQACEHDGWETSEAKRFCDALRHALIGAVPGYRDAPWEWTAETVAEHKQADSLEGRRARTR